MSTERMARLLARRLEEEGERTGAEVSVEELLDRYVPYGAARQSLELTTKSEYDLLVLEFLADRRLTVLGDPEVAEAAARELETPEPGLGPLEEHADVTLRLDLATISGGYSGDAPRPAEESEAAWDPTGGVEARPAGPSAGDAADGSGETDGSSDIEGSDGAAGASDGSAGDEDSDCRRCGASLPVDAEVPVRFCPHCGTSRPERACPECETALEPGWTYCPACGARASPSGGGAA